MLGAAEALGTVDDHHVGADAVDPGAHLGQQPGQVLNVGLGGGVGDLGRPRGQRRRHQRVLGPHHRGLVHEDLAGAETAGGALSSIQRSPVDPGAEVLEGVEVGVEAAAADEVTAGRRHPGLAETRQQRPGQQEGGPDPARELLVDNVSATPAAQRRTLLSATHSTSTPSCSSRAICASVSRIRGTRCSSTSSSVSRQAARIGSAAFLLPATATSPGKRRPALDDELLHRGG